MNEDSHFADDLIKSDSDSDSESESESNSESGSDSEADVFETPASPFPKKDFEKIQKNKSKAPTLRPLSSGRIISVQKNWYKLVPMTGDPTAVSSLSTST